MKLYAFPPRDGSIFGAAPSFGAVDGEHCVTVRAASAPAGRLDAWRGDRHFNSPTNSRSRFELEDRYELDWAMAPQRKDPLSAPIGSLGEEFRGIAGVNTAGVGGIFRHSENT